MTDAVTVEQALEQTRQATELATRLAGALNEARALLIQVLAIDPAELEAPIGKELKDKDIERSRELDRQTLEQQYAVARMTTRLSMWKVEDLEGKVHLLEERLASKAEECDEAAQLLTQLTTSAMNLRADVARHQRALDALEELKPTDFQGRDDYHQALVRILLDHRNDQEA